jgi:hypothetical protein
MCTGKGTEKLKPLVKGKSKKLKCFEDVKSLSVIHKCNTTSWMTSSMAEDWLHWTDQKSHFEKKKAFCWWTAVFLARMKELCRFKAAFLPPNATTKPQPKC